MDKSVKLLVWTNAWVAFYDFDETIAYLSNNSDSETKSFTLNFLKQTYL